MGKNTISSNPEGDSSLSKEISHVFSGCNVTGHDVPVMRMLWVERRNVGVSRTTGVEHPLIASTVSEPEVKSSSDEGTSVRQARGWDTGFMVTP